MSLYSLDKWSKKYDEKICETGVMVTLHKASVSRRDMKTHLLCAFENTRNTSHALFFN